MASTTMEAVKLSIDGHIATIKLNRPERLNAVNDELRQGLHAALDKIASNDDVRVAILIGEGRGFCAGADVAQMGARLNRAEETSREQQELEARLNAYRFWNPTEPSLPVHIRAIPQPVIAAVNGVAAGMGLSISLSCDIRVASDQARFASIFIKRSIMPDNGGTFFLPHQVGPGIAAEMALTGNIYDANWALEKGLVNKVVPHESLMDEARAYAETIAGNPPIGVRMTKQLLQWGLLADLQEAIANEGHYNSLTAQTEDRKEGVRAFLEKRTPVFRGR